MRRNLNAFTLIALLVALLLPALRKSKQVAQRTTCMANLHQFYIAVSSYASDAGEYPNNGIPTTWASLSFFGENSGNTGAMIVPMLINGGYTTASGLQCNASFPHPGSDFFAFLSATAWYNFAGPSAYSTFLQQYGHNSGLAWRSRFYPHWGAPDPLATDQHSWGCSVRNNWMRLMAVCPTIDYQNAVAYEPHDDQPLTSPIQNVDQESEGWDVRRRNALYNDGHAVYWQMDSAGTPADYQ